jgi:hypothetical protein
LTKGHFIKVYPHTRNVKLTAFDVLGYILEVKGRARFSAIIPTLQLRSAKPRGRVCFVTARLEGTDGVSLETLKWIKAYIRMGYEVYVFAGKADEGELLKHGVRRENIKVYDEAELYNGISGILNGFFNGDLKDDLNEEEIRSRINQSAEKIVKELSGFIDEKKISHLVLENLSLPMQVPLAIASKRVIDSRKIPSISHDHDFSVERGRFKRGPKWLRGLILETCPVRSDYVIHCSINPYALGILSSIPGIRKIYDRPVPNVDDFSRPFIILAASFFKRSPAF